jgi:hypothetical protein
MHITREGTEACVKTQVHGSLSVTILRTLQVKNEYLRVCIWGPGPRTAVHHTPQHPAVL